MQILLIAEQFALNALADIYLKQLKNIK